MPSEGSSYMLKIYKAVKGRNDALLEKLLSALQHQQGVVERKPLEYRDEDGCTPLIVAAANNCLTCVRLLLEHGAKVNAMSAGEEGGTAFHHAARMGGEYAAVCKLLYKKGANPFLADCKGRTPLDEAILAGQPAHKDSGASTSTYARILKRMSKLHKNEKQEAMQLDWQEFVETILKRGQLWKGRLEIRVRHAYTADRLFMVVPHCPCPISDWVPESSGKRLLVFEDSKELQLKISGVLDEATFVSKMYPTTLKLAWGMKFIYTDPYDEMEPDYPKLLDMWPVTSARADLGAFVALVEAMPVPSAPPRMVEEKEEDSQKACVICLSAPKTVGLLHGTSVHKCVCGECAKDLVVGTTPCPMCRMIVEGVLDIYD